MGYHWSVIWLVLDSTGYLKLSSSKKINIKFIESYSFNIVAKRDVFKRVKILGHNHHRKKQVVLYYIWDLWKKIKIFQTKKWSLNKITVHVTKYKIQYCKNK